VRQSKTDARVVMPSQTPPIPPIPPSDTSGRARRATHRALRFAVSVVIGGAALVGLGVGAVHAVRQTTSLSTAADVRAWQRDARYWACLDSQAHSLVRSGTHVFLVTHSLSDLVILEKVLSPWAIVVQDRDQASMQLSAREATGPDTCLGIRLQGRYPNPSGPGTIIRAGTGGSDPGHGSLPSTPL
jgi:hypothetical protein